MLVIVLSTLCLALIRVTNVGLFSERVDVFPMADCKRSSSPLPCRNISACEPSTFNLLRNRSFCTSQSHIYVKLWISFLTDFEFKLKRSLCVVQVFLNPFRSRRLFMAFKLASSTTASHSDRTQSIANLATEGHGFVNWDSRTSAFLMRPDALKLMKEFGFPFGEPRPKRVCILEDCWSYDEWQVKHFGQRCSFETWILGSRVKGPLCEVQEARQEGQKGPQEGLGLPTDASLQQPVLAEAIASTCRRAPFLQSRLLVADSPKQINF